VHNQCTTAIALLSDLTKKLLDGEKFTELQLHWTLLTHSRSSLDCPSNGPQIGKHLFTTKLESSPDSLPPHTVLKVRGSLSKKTWIIDPAGSQYGYRGVLLPYDKYISEKLCQVVNKSTNYDWTETKDLDYYATFPFMNSSERQRENLKLERQARLKFAAFVNGQVNKEILKGSATEFMGKSMRFSSGLKFYML
jgi:hypothetical protein